MTKETHNISVYKLELQYFKGNTKAGAKLVTNTLWRKDRIGRNYWDENRTTKHCGMHEFKTYCIGNPNYVAHFLNGDRVPFHAIQNYRVAEEFKFTLNIYDRHKLVKVKRFFGLFNGTKKVNRYLHVLTVFGTKEVIFSEYSDTFTFTPDLEKIEKYLK